MRVVPSSRGEAGRLHATGSKVFEERTSFCEQKEAKKLY
jgi:hypothetical protein